MLDGFQESFKEEAYELLSSLEQSLLELEENPDDLDTISAVFRSMHTIKGSAAMFGFDRISEFTHHVETMLDDVRNGRLSVTRSLIDLTLSCRDHVRHMLDEPEDEQNDAESHRLIQRLNEETESAKNAGREPLVIDQPISTSGIGSDGSPASAVPPPKADDSDGAGVTKTWHIGFRPDATLLVNGTNPLLLLAELHDLGECTAVVDTKGIGPLDETDVTQAMVGWDIFLTTDQPRSAIEEVFLFVQGQCRLSFRLVDEIDFSDEEEHTKRLGQILVERGVVDASVVERAVSQQKRLGQVLVNEGVDAHEVESALQEQEHIRRARQKVQTEAAAASIRVQSEKLDDLVDLVGELVTLQARLSQTVDNDSGGGLQAIAENFDRLISELRDHTMSIRMVPISSTFSRFRRLVRDLSRELGKEVDLITEGGDTELDKTVIERLHDPLVHVIRNSVDHGLESPGVRAAAGKSETGTVSLIARHVGASVEVRVEDDGKGIDTERVRMRAVERGLISKDAELSESEVADLVFQPGFSTAEAITTVSGRGVGMDVVRKELEKIGGSVSIRSRPGRGTTIIMSIPLTLAIIDGLLVRIARERFVVPLSNVEECIEYQGDSKKSEVVTVRGELLPIVDLRREFGITGERPEREQAVVVDTGIGRVGFVVDAVIGDHQTVIKNLGRLYNTVDTVSGATILGDGSVALILDVQRLAMGKGNAARRA